MTIFVEMQLGLHKVGIKSDMFLQFYLKVVFANNNSFNPGRR